MKRRWSGEGNKTLQDDSVQVHTSLCGIKAQSSHIRHAVANIRHKGCSPTWWHSRFDTSKSQKDSWQDYSVEMWYENKNFWEGSCACRLKQTYVYSLPLEEEHWGTMSKSWPVSYCNRIKTSVLEMKNRCRAEFSRQLTVTGQSRQADVPVTLPRCTCSVTHDNIADNDGPEQADNRHRCHALLFRVRVLQDFKMGYILEGLQGQVACCTPVLSTCSIVGLWSIVCLEPIAARSGHILSCHEFR